MTFKLMDVMPGAHNLVVGYAQVKKGDNVLVYADTGIEDLVVDAVAAAASNAGANVTVAITSPIEDAGGNSIIDPPKIIRHAFYGADVILSLISVYTYHWSVRTVTTACIEYGCRLFYIAPITAHTMASEWTRFPMELDVAIGKKVTEAVRRNCDRLRVTDERGTDVTASFDPVFVVGAVSPRTQPGDWNIAPKSVIGITRFKDVNGVACPDILEADGPLTEPCKWTIKNGWVTDIEGGREAKVLKEWVSGIKNANLFSEIMWGLNPKGSRKEYLTPPWDMLKMELMTRTSGTLHFAMGSPPSRQGGDTSKAADIHTHGVWSRPTIYAGDEPIIIKGHLVALDDPEIRQIASKYGHPDDVLGELD